MTCTRRVDGRSNSLILATVRLVIANGEDLRYCQATKQWFCWDEQRFAVDLTGEVKRRAKRTVRNMLLEAAAMDNEKHRKELIAARALSRVHLQPST